MQSKKSQEQESLVSILKHFDVEERAYAHNGPIALQSLLEYASMDPADEMLNGVNLTCDIHRSYTKDEQPASTPIEPNEKGIVESINKRTGSVIFYVSAHASEKAASSAFEKIETVLKEKFKADYQVITDKHARFFRDKLSPLPTLAFTIPKDTLAKVLVKSTFFKNTTGEKKELPNFPVFDLFFNDKISSLTVRPYEGEGIFTEKNTNIVEQYNQFFKKKKLPDNFKQDALDFIVWGWVDPTGHQIIRDLRKLGVEVVARNFKKTIDGKAYVVFFLGFRGASLLIDDHIKLRKGRSEFIAKIHEKASDGVKDFSDNPLAVANCLSSCCDEMLFAVAVATEKLLTILNDSTFLKAVEDVYKGTLSLERCKKIEEELLKYYELSDPVLITLLEGTLNKLLNDHMDIGFERKPLLELSEAKSKLDRVRNQFTPRFIKALQAMAAEHGMELDASKQDYVEYALFDFLSALEWLKGLPLNARFITLPAFEKQPEPKPEELPEGILFKEGYSYLAKDSTVIFKDGYIVFHLGCSLGQRTPNERQGLQEAFVFLQKQIQAKFSLSKYQIFNDALSALWMDWVDGVDHDDPVRLVFAIDAKEFQEKVFSQESTILTALRAAVTGKKGQAYMSSLAKSTVDTLMKRLEPYLHINDPVLNNKMVKFASSLQDTFSIAQEKNDRITLLRGELELFESYEKYLFLIVFEPYLTDLQAIKPFTMESKIYFDPQTSEEEIVFTLCMRNVYLAEDLKKEQADAIDGLRKKMAEDFERYKGIDLVDSPECIASVVMSGIPLLQFAFSRTNLLQLINKSPLGLQIKTLEAIERLNDGDLTLQHKTVTEEMTLQLNKATSCSDSPPIIIEIIAGLQTRLDAATTRLNRVTQSSHKLMGGNKKITLKSSDFMDEIIQAQHHGNSPPT